MLTMIDLFAGCGGLSLGLEMEGFHPVFVSELNKDALRSYLANRSTLASHLLDRGLHCRDIRELTCSKKAISKLRADLKSVFNLKVSDGDLDVLVGGPPCQGFSGIGHRRSYAVSRSRVPANYLYEEMARMVNFFSPKIFLFENVRGLLSARWTKRGIKGEIFDHVLQTFHSLKNYRVSHGLVFAKDYGVPQNRPRVLLVGVRKDVDLSPWSSDLNEHNIFLPTEKSIAPDLLDVLGDLVDEKYENGGHTQKYPVAPKNAIQRFFRTTPDGKMLKKGGPLTEHEYTFHSAAVRKKFIHMIEGNGQIPFSMRSRKFAQRLLPARWGDGGPTITVTSMPDDYVHFSQPRILTVREWARLQGFPDWYQFCGPRTTGGLRRAGNPRAGMFERELPKYTQIGNAVPIAMARAIGKHFKSLLEPYHSAA